MKLIDAPGSSGSAPDHAASPGQAGSSNDAPAPNASPAASAATPLPNPYADDAAPALPPGGPYAKPAGASPSSPEAPSSGRRGTFAVRIPSAAAPAGKALSESAESGSPSADEAAPEETPRPTLNIAPPGINSDAATAPPEIERRDQQKDSHHAIKATSGPLAQLTIERQGPAELSIGEPADYKLTVRNTGTTPVEHVHLEVLLPSKSYALPEQGGRRERLAWKLGTIRPGSSVTVPVSFLCREAGEAKLETWLFSPSIEQSAIRVVEPTLLVELAPSEELKVGQSAALKVVVKNTGKGVARDVKLTLELPDTLRQVRENTGPTAIGELASGESMRLEIPVHVVAPGPASARTTVSAAGGVELSSQHPVDVLAPKIKLSTTGVAVQNIGEIEMYAAEIVNDGTQPLEWVTVVTTLDRGLLLVDAEAGAEIDPGMRLLGWEINNLAPGASKTLRWWAVAQRPGEGRQQVFVEADGNVKADTTILTDLRLAAAVGLQVSERDAATTIGQEVIYQVRLFNHSEVIGEDLVLSCELPPGLEPVRAASGGERTWTGRTATFGPLAPLAPGEHRVFQVRARAEKAGWHTLRLVLSQGRGGPLVAEAAEETLVRTESEAKAAAADEKQPLAPSPPGSGATD
ncbi:MAG TPA: hypothetical protein VGE52_04780 [Pirellulales bacterium]